MLAVVLSLCLRDWTVTPADTSWARLLRHGRWLAGAAAIVSAAIAVHWGIFAAGGADAYGYVSQAALWAGGHLSAPDPLAAIATLVGPSAAPLGYRLAVTPGSIVPIYPAGLPLAMAIAMSIGGPPAAYLVVPLFAGLAVWLTYLLGARIADARAGLLAAILVAFSPIFVFQSLEPMSDVPATMWWLFAWVLALSPRGDATFAAGLAVSAALLTRPNLVPLSLVLAVVAALQAPQLKRTALFVLGMLPGCVAVAALNAHWCGSPLRSGYGPLDRVLRVGPRRPEPSPLLGVDARARRHDHAARDRGAVRGAGESGSRRHAGVLRRADRVLPLLPRLRYVAVLPFALAGSAARARARLGGDGLARIAAAARLPRRGHVSCSARCFRLRLYRPRIA